MAQTAKLLTCTEEVTGSNVDRPTDYSKVFHSFPHSTGILEKKKNLSQIFQLFISYHLAIRYYDRVVK